MSSQIFPTGFIGIMLTQQRTPVWSTQVQQSLSGKETRISRRSSPLMKFELAFEVLQDSTNLAVSDLKRLLGFYNAMQGSYDTFLYSDPNFNSVSAHSYGTGDGVTTSFQVAATYKDSTGIGWPEAIQNFNGTPAFYNNGSLQTLTTHYTLSGTGVITYTTAPAAGVALTWTGGFYYRCRFLDDSLSLQEIVSRWWELRKLAVQSVRL